MVSGTYVLTDSISQRVRRDLRARSTRTRTPSSPARRPSISAASGTTTAPPFSESLLAEVEALPDVAGRDRRRRRRGAADREERQGDRVRRRAQPRLQRRPDAARRSTRSRSRAAPGRRPDEVVVDAATAEEEEPRGRADDRRAGRGPGRAVPDLRDRQVRSRRHDRRRHPGRLRPARPRSGCSARSASSTRSASRRSRASRRPSSSPEIEPMLPPGTQVQERRARRRRATPRTRTASSRFLQKFLLAFGGIALFVGAFVIANSLSITIAQRTREFATLRTLGASRRQVLGSVIVEALVMGVRRVGHRPVARASCSARACSSSSTPSASRCRTTGITVETRTIVVALLGGHRRDAARQPAAGVARDPGAADRGRARGCDAPRRALPPLPRARCGRNRAARARRAALRRLRQRPRHEAGAAPDRRRRAAHLLRRRALLRPPRRPDGARARLARDPDRRRRRLARPRQLAAQPAAHRVDRCGADDRPRPRDARRDARGGHHRHVQRLPSTTSLAASSTRSRPRTTSRRSRSARPGRREDARASRPSQACEPARCPSSRTRDSSPAWTRRSAA